MNKKISIAAFALAASTSSFALIGPGGPQRPPLKRACIEITKGAAGVRYAGNCDETHNNETFKRALNAEGCAAGQALFTSTTIELQQCRDPRIVQL